MVAVNSPGRGAESQGAGQSEFGAVDSGWIINEEDFAVGREVERGVEGADTAGAEGKRGKRECGINRSVRRQAEDFVGQVSIASAHDDLAIGLKQQACADCHAVEGTR